MRFDSMRQPKISPRLASLVVCLPILAKQGLKNVRLWGTIMHLFLLPFRILHEVKFSFHGMAPCFTVLPSLRSMISSAGRSLDVMHALKMGIRNVIYKTYRQEPTSLDFVVAISQQRQRS